MNPNFWLVSSLWKKNIQVLGLGQALRSKIWGLDVGFLTWLCDQKSKFLAFVRKSDSRPGLSNLDQALRSELFYPGPGSRFENLIIFCPWSASVPENPIFVAMARLCVRNLSFRLPRPGSVFENLSRYCHNQALRSKFFFYLPSTNLCIRKFELFHALVRQNSSFFVCLGQALCSKFLIFTLARFPSTSQILMMETTENQKKDSSTTSFTHIFI